MIEPRRFSSAIATVTPGLLGLLAACAERPAALVTPAPPSAPIASASATVEAPAVPTAMPLDESPFKLVATVPAALDVYPERDRVFVTTQGRMVGEIRGDAYVDRPELAVRPSFVPPRNAAGLVGVSAGAGETLYASWSFAEGRMGATMLVKWDGKAWQDLKVRSVNAAGLGDPVPWTRGRVMALETPSMGAIGPRSNVVLVDGPKQALPRVPKTKGRSQDCKAWILASELAAMANGELWVLGSTCPATYQAQGDRAVPVVHRFAEDGKDLGITKLPFPTKNLDGSPFVPAAAADLNYVVFPQVLSTEANRARLKISEHGEGPPRSWLARFDGTTWTAEVVPPDQLTASVGSAGGHFELRHERTEDKTTEEDRLWQLRANEPPRRIALPKGADGRPVHVARFWSRGPDDLWLVATAPDGTRFYRTKPNAPPLTGLPAIDEDEQKPAKPTRAGPLTKDCPTVFVLLYTLAKTAPRDYDFPATRDALKGRGDLEPSLSFIEFERGGQRFFGARAASASVAQTVAKLVKEKVPGAGPAVVCDDPEASRTLSIDLATGKMRATPSPAAKASPSATTPPPAPLRAPARRPRSPPA